MEFEAWHIWLIVGIILMVIEIFTPSFVAGSFGIGSILTSITAAITDNINIQILSCIVLSVFAFILIRPFLLKMDKNKGKQTNVDSLTGKVFSVNQTIGPNDNIGYIKSDGDLWRCKTETGETIPEGEKVKIIRIDGNTLIVEKY